jgi:hypothetical protein
MTLGAMNIDKHRFLLLTSSLAAGTVAIAASQIACQTVANDAKNDASAPATTFDSGSPVTPSESTSDAGDAGACLGNEGAAPLCGPAQEGEDAGGYAQCSYECTQLTTNFKTAVAREMSACLDRKLALPTTEGCAAATVPCATEVLAKACDDPTATTFCTTWLASCGDAGPTPTASECTTLVRATTAAGRTTLQSCATEGGDCGFCLEMLRNAL